MSHLDSPRLFSRYHGYHEARPPRRLVDLSTTSAANPPGHGVRLLGRQPAWQNSQGRLDPRRSRADLSSPLEVSFSRVMVKYDKIVRDRFHLLADYFKLDFHVLNYYTVAAFRISLRNVLI